MDIDFGTVITVEGREEHRDGSFRCNNCTTYTKGNGGWWSTYCGLSGEVIKNNKEELPRYISELLDSEKVRHEDGSIVFKKTERDGLLEFLYAVFTKEDGEKLFFALLDEWREL